MCTNFVFWFCCRLACSKGSTSYKCNSFWMAIFCLMITLLAKIDNLSFSCGHNVYVHVAKLNCLESYYLKWVVTFPLMQLMTKTLIIFLYSHGISLSINMVKIKWNYLSSLNHNFIVLCELLMPCQLFVQKCSNCQETTEISKCSGSPRTLCHWQYTLYIGIFCYWVLLHYNMSFKTVAGGFNGAFW